MITDESRKTFMCALWLQIQKPCIRKLLKWNRQRNADNWTCTVGSLSLKPYFVFAIFKTSAHFSDKSNTSGDTCWHFLELVVMLASHPGVISFDLLRINCFKCQCWGPLGFRGVGSRCESTETLVLCAPGTTISLWGQLVYFWFWSVF